MDDQIWESNLLREMEKRPAIWLLTHPNHTKNRTVRALWREIAAIVNVNRKLFFFISLFKLISIVICHLNFFVALDCKIYICISSSIYIFNVLDTNVLNNRTKKIFFFHQSTQLKGGGRN